MQWPHASCVDKLGSTNYILIIIPKTTVYMVRRHLIHQFNQFATTIDHTGLKTHDELGRAKICKNRTGLDQFKCTFA
jgi:hypothetical protein